MSINKSICVVIKDKNSINNCWYNGFYGKGNLSRSTPNWSERILRDIVKRNSGIKLKIPENTLDDNFSSGIKRFKQWNKKLIIDISQYGFILIQSFFNDLILLITNPCSILKNIKDNCERYIFKKDKLKFIKSTDLMNMEYLQLDLEEAFFLKYALNCISIKDNHKILSIDDCWKRFRSNINNPSDPFILKYIAYHYYRSQGWIVKEGLKYGVDYGDYIFLYRLYILYQKGPIFSHSEYAISIIPVMNDQNKLNYIIDMPTIHEINCTNRVCNQVLKKLVYCYIIIPKDIDLNSPDCLKKYSIYEIRMKRWNPDKTRN
eukprot:jgi/Orpsp1_1/1174102/evm.model.c7180000048916.1